MFVNDNTKIVKQRISESIDVKSLLLADETVSRQIAKLADECAAAFKKGGKIILAGNGGSFGDAQHISAEFTSKLMRDRGPLASIALGTNSSAMSAIANDYGYENVFSRELEAILQPEDVIILLSTSGNSKNILNAAITAKRANLKVSGLTGSDGGYLSKECECINVPSTETARIQECHILIGHILVELAERHYFA
jgi:D-sedoheptulose 7-phosphate isomerase